MVDVEKALIDPALVFKTPEEVLALYSVQIGHPIRSKAAGQSGPKQPGVGAKRRWSFSHSLRLT
jgi:hypothetical protein